MNVFNASGSVDENVPMPVPVTTFSAMLTFESASAVGASLTLVTVIVNCCSNVKPSWSVVWTRIA